MSGFVESMVAQFVFVQTPDLIFSDLVDELGEALDRSGAGDRVTQWDCEDMALMDLGGLRFALAWCRHPMDDQASCLTLSVGPAPGSDGRLAQGLHPEEMCQLLARRLESVLLPDMTFWHRVDGPVDSDVIDRLIDSLPEVGVMRSIGAFRAKPRPFAAVQAEADADIDALLARVAEPDAPAPARPEEPRATANSTVADPPGAVVDLLARLSGDAPARQSARRSPPRAAPVPLTAAAAAVRWDPDPDTARAEPDAAAAADTAPPAVALHVVSPAAFEDDDLPRPVAPDPAPAAPRLAAVDPYAIDPAEDDDPATPAADAHAPVPRAVRPARAPGTGPRTPRPDPDTAARHRAQAVSPWPEHGSVEERARLRSALYPPEEPVALADRPSPQLRLAAHAMDATLIVVAPPVGAALMTYGILRGSDLVRSGRAMAVTCTAVGLLQGPLLALI